MISEIFFGSEFFVNQPGDENAIVRTNILQPSNASLILATAVGEGSSVILSNGHEVEVARRKKDLLIAKMKEFYKF